MSRLDELPPDQRATLSLLLHDRKGYAEIAALLGIAERAVHDRAHAALAVLAPRAAREVPTERREQIGEYLLGQQHRAAEQLETRTFLSESEVARAWAEEIAGALAPIAREPLPPVPNRVASSAGGRTPSPALPSSRLGGALLLVAIVAAIVVAVVLITSSGGSHKSGNATAASRSHTSSSASGPRVDARFTLRSPIPGSRTVGAVAVLSEAGKRAFYIAAEHLPPSRGFHYDIWLYNSPTSAEALSEAPSVGSNGQLAGGAFLPSNAGEYHEMLLTRETSSRPTTPGTIVLHGPFKLG